MYKMKFKGGKLLLSGTRNFMTQIHPPTHQGVESGDLFVFPMVYCKETRI